MIIADGHMTAASFPPQSDIGKAKFYITAYNTELGIVSPKVEVRGFQIWLWSKSFCPIGAFFLKKKQKNWAVFCWINYLTTLLHEIITKHVVSLLNSFWLEDNTKKKLRENYSDGLFFFLKCEVSVGEESKQKKVHFTSQRVKIFLHTNFDRWENTGTFNIKDL